MNLRFTLFLILSIIISGEALYLTINYWPLVEKYETFQAYKIWPLTSIILLVMLALSFVYWLMHFRRYWSILPLLILLSTVIATQVVPIEVTYGAVYDKFFQDGHMPWTPFDNDRLLADLKSEQYQEVEQQFVEHYASVSYQPDMEMMLVSAFSIFTTEKDDSLKPYLDAWVEAVGSPHALIARGYYVTQQAWDVRDEKFTRDIPVEDRARIRVLVTDAINDLERAIELTPSYIAPYYHLMDAYALAGRYEDANQMLEKSLKQFPDAYYLRYAYLSYHLEPRWGGSLDAMYQFGQQAHQLRMSNPRLVAIQGQYFSYRAVFNHAKAPEQAVALINHALRYGPLSKWYIDLANLYAKQGNVAGQLEAYNRILEKQPNHIGALVNRALIMKNSGELEQAVSDVSRAFNIKPNNAWVATTAGWIFETAGDNDNAIKAYRACIKADPAYMYPYSRLAFLYHAYKKNTKAALSVVRQQNKLQPEKPEPWLYIADYMYDLKMSGAQYYVEKYLSLIDKRDPGNQAQIDMANQLLKDIKNMSP